jgi:hypothetical protein
MNKRLLLPLGLAALLLALVPACTTNTQGDDASPVYLSVEFKERPLKWNVASGATLQVKTVEILSHLKDPKGVASDFLDTRIESYLVEWKRLDGGTISPKTEVFAGNFVVPAGGQSTLTDYPFMMAGTTALAPLDQLFPYNGGIDRETGSTEIHCAATVTFRGHTLSGQRVEGWGILDMPFYYQALTGRVEAAK